MSSDDEPEPAYPLLRFQVELDEGDPSMVLFKLESAKGLTKYLVRRRMLETIAAECATAVAKLRDLD
jgi:hypothetical protein